MLNVIVENGVVVGCKEGAKSVTLPTGVHTIARTAFYECDVEEIILNEDLKTIEALAFLGTNIKTLYIPEGVEKIGTGVVSGCTLLESIVVNENNKHYYFQNNCLVERNTNKVIAVMGDAIVPNGITEISKLAFYGRTKNIVVEIPESVKEIGIMEVEFLPALEFPITIKAKQGSYAMDFANENEIDCVIKTD